MRLRGVGPNHSVIGFDGNTRQVLTAGGFQRFFAGAERGLRGHDVRTTRFGTGERIFLR